MSPDPGPRTPDPSRLQHDLAERAAAVEQLVHAARIGRRKARGLASTVLIETAQAATRFLLFMVCLLGRALSPAR